jgi:competence protein ComEC
VTWVAVRSSTLGSRDRNLCASGAVVEVVRKRIGQLVGIVLLLLSLTTAAAGQTLSIQFLDVGQGDAILIVGPEGKKILIDAGPAPWQITQVLGDRNYDTLDLVVASHNHADHIGGMAGVLATKSVRFYLDNGVPHNTATYARTISLLDSTTQYLQAAARTLTVGATTIRVLSLPPNLSGQNNNSVGLLLGYGEFSALFIGDAETPEIEYWLHNDSIPSVQVLKVSHHGSSNGMTASLAQATKPQVAVVSVGANNTYGHPSADVIATWESIGTRVYRTDLDGSIEVFAEKDGSFTVVAARRPVLIDSSKMDSIVAYPPRTNLPANRSQ